MEKRQVLKGRVGKEVPRGFSEAIRYNVNIWETHAQILQSSLHHRSSGIMLVLYLLDGE